MTISFFFFSSLIIWVNYSVCATKFSIWVRRIKFKIEFKQKTTKTNKRREEREKKSFLIETNIYLTQWKNICTKLNLLGRSVGRRRRSHSRCCFFFFFSSYFFVSYYLSYLKWLMMFTTYTTHKNVFFSQFYLSLLWFFYLLFVVFFCWFALVYVFF